MILHPFLCEASEASLLKFTKRCEVSIIPRPIVTISLYSPNDNISRYETLRICKRQLSSYRTFILAPNISEFSGGNSKKSASPFKTALAAHITLQWNSTVGTILLRIVLAYI